MIVLHRLGRPTDHIYVNRDLILTVEANPDTVITLTTGDRIVVSEPPDEVADRVREGRAQVAVLALRRRGQRVIRPVESHHDRSLEAILTPVEPEADVQGC